MDKQMTAQELISADKFNLGDLDLNEEVKTKLCMPLSIWRAPQSDITEQAQRKEKALKSMRKLINISEQYSAYCNEVLKKSEQERVDSMMQHKKSTNRKSLLNIPYFEGVLKDYQIIGVEWLKILFEHGVNGILADEMGLGKTIQVIALICDLIKKIKGPFLIVVPLSTLPNWGREFERFAPEIPVVSFHGDVHARYNLMGEILRIYNMGEETVRPVVLTTVQMVAKQMSLFKKITWKYLIVDEGHCLKNYQSQVSQNMRCLNSQNKLILTGTPLQNNLTELWSILNFIMPNIFKNIDTFSSLFVLEDFDDNSKIVKEEQTNSVISSLHKVLQPFILRRLKSDVLLDLVPKKEVLVHCPLTNLQRMLYMYTIKKNINGLFGKVEDDKENLTLLDAPRPKRRCCNNRQSYEEALSDDSFSEEDDVESILGVKVKPNIKKFAHNVTMGSALIMFKKIVNHPYLVNMPITPQKTLVVDERLVSESGKMLVLDLMLPKLKERNHKVLIFSTLVMMLDLIEEVMILRNYSYCRLDGQCALSDREESIKRFNTDPNMFIFLISTRAGGLGLNLTGADTVIMFDRDWNPQIDTQAQDRCHRIGQTKPVVVYSFITKNTIDERIFNCGNMKKKLEKVVIKGGKFNRSSINKDSELDLQELLNILENDDSLEVHKNSHIFSDAEWLKLLDRSDLYEQMKKTHENK